MQLSVVGLYRSGSGHGVTHRLYSGSKINPGEHPEGSVVVIAGVVVITGAVVVSAGAVVVGVPVCAEKC